MKIAATILVLSGLALLTAPAQTNSTTTNAAPRRRFGGGGGGDMPAATNDISFRCISVNARGDTIAKIVVDTSEVPELAPWGKHAAEICAEWYPKIEVLLGVDDELFPPNGKAAISSADITDLESLAGKLKHPANPVSSYFADHLSPTTKKLLTDYNGGRDNDLRQAIAEDLNQIVETEVIYDEQRFAASAVKLTPETQELLAKKTWRKINHPQSPKAAAENSKPFEHNNLNPSLIQLNRMLVGMVYPAEVTDGGPRTIHLWFRKNMSGVANTSPREGVIRFSASYVQSHTNDWGMVVHELTHTVQSFGGSVARTAPSFSQDDIKDVSSLAAKLKEHKDPVSQFLWDQLSPTARKSVADYSDTGTNAASRALQMTLATELGGVIRKGSIYQEARFADVTLSDFSKNMLAQNPEGDRVARLNRLLLQDAYPQEITRGRQGAGAGGSWLTEGIADYIRLGHYEPTRLRRASTPTAPNILIPTKRPPRSCAG